MDQCFTQTSSLKSHDCWRNV